MGGFCLKRFLFAAVACALALLTAQNLLFPRAALASSSAGAEPEITLQAGEIVGSAVEDLTARYGEPSRTEPSEYGFVWYVFNGCEEGFFLAGVREGVVVALYTNAAGLGYEEKILFGSARAALWAQLGAPFEPAACSNTISAFAERDRDLFAIGEDCVVAFYDDMDGLRVTALMVLPMADEADALLYRSELMEGQSAALRRIGEDIARAAEARDAALAAAGMRPGAAMEPALGATERETAELLVEYAKLFLGRPYESGAAGPDAFECSGLTHYVYRQFGVTIPRKAQGQGYADYGTKIMDRADLLPGDLVFFNSNPDDKDLCDHVGIYVGKGKFIHSPAPGMTVRISGLTRAKDFSWGRRIFE